MFNLRTGAIMTTEDAYDIIYNLAEQKIEEIELEGKNNEQAEIEFNKLAFYKNALAVVHDFGVNVIHK